jgi:tripartite-type tricarboxylate transporter receptor subunit TctC
MQFRRLALASLLAIPLIVPLAASAQGFPSKPLRLVVPYAPGGAVDAFARPTAQKLSEILGQAVVVDNKPGANTTIGADNVAKSAADGYSLILTSINHYIVPFFSKNVPYDATRDFTPVAQVGVTPNIVAVHPSLPAATVKEFIDYAKQNPGKLYYGTTGVGSTHHLAGVMLGQLAGINIEHLPYKGGSPTINDALGGQIPVVILTASTILPFARQGKLRALGVIEAKRARAAPEIPSIGETVPGYAVPATWFGVLGPAGMPRAVTERLNAAFRQAVNAPEVRQRLETGGFEITGSASPDEFAAAIAADTEVFRKIVTSAGIRPE